MKAKSFPRAEDLIGRMVDRFEIRALLGAGGMGEVLKAWDTKFCCYVALKRISPRLAAYRRAFRDFAAEAERAAAFKHHRVSTLFPPFTTTEGTFFVMEFVDGETLRQRLQRGFTIEQFQTIAVQSIDALNEAHARGILHRDLKPENIMITRSGDVKICDFGLAMPVTGPSAGALPVSTDIANAPTVVDSGGFQGTPRYAAPEVLAGARPSPQSDLYSLGVVFREMLPHLLEPKDPWVSHFAGLMLKLTDRDPARRFQTAGEVLQALQSMDGTTMPGNARALQRIGILPAETAGQRPEDEALAKGIVEVLGQSLRLLLTNSNYLVIPYSEVQSKNVRSARSARSDLGASHVLSTTVTRTDPRIIHCEVEIVETAAQTVVGKHVAARPSLDAFELVEELAGAIRQMLGVPAGAEPEAKADVVRPGAFELYLRGRGYLQNFDRAESLDHAVAVFKKALELDTDHALSHAGLGEAYWRKYEISSEVALTDLAKQSVLRAISIDRDLAVAQSCLGMVLSGCGEYERAIEAYTRAIERDPFNDAHHSGLGAVLERLGRQAEAENAYRRTIRMQPQYWAGYNQLAKFLFSQGRYSEAGDCYQQILTLVPDSFWAYIGLGACRFAAGDNAGAIQCFEKSLEIRTTDIAASNLGFVFFYMGDYPRAAECFQTALGVNDKDHRTWSHLAAAWRWAGRRDESKKAYLRAAELAERQLELNSRSGDGLSLLAGYYAGLGDTERSLELLRRALANAPSNGTVCFRAASIYCDDLAKPEEALEYLKLAVKFGFPVQQIVSAPSLKALKNRAEFQLLVAAATGKP